MLSASSSRLRLTPLALAVHITLLATVASAQTSTTAGSASAESTSELKQVTVSAPAEQNPTTEGTASYTTESMSSATRLNLSPRETPQSVGVVTRQQIEDQGIQSLEEITNLATGITLSKGATERAGFYSRGFQINNFTQDGLPMSNSADTLGFDTLAMYDRIEIVRGPAGLLTGAGSPGGTLNLVRKRPTHETQVSVTGSLGRYNDRRVELDASGALNEAKTVRGRAVLAARDADTYISNYQQQRQLVYATVDADLGRDTTASVGFHYTEEKNPGSTWYGLPTAYNGSFLPLDRSANTAPDWTFWNKTNTRVFAELEHHFGNDWKAKLAGQMLTDKLDSKVNGTERIGTSEIFRINSANIFTYDREQRAVDLQFSGPVQMFGQKHDIVFGATHRTLNQDDLGFNAPGYTYRFDPVNWNTAAPPEPAITNLYYGSTTRTKQNGAYATGRFKLAQPLALLLGARVDTFEYTAGNPLTGASTANYEVSQEITPYLGLVFDLNDTYSVYGSWTSVFNPQNVRDEVGNLLDPVTGVNMEVGVKAEYFGGALNVSAAAFQLRQTNLPLALPVSQCKASLSCSEAAGEVESKGLEFEAAGALTANWQVMAGLTYNTAEYAQDSSAGKAGTKFATDRPSRLAKLSTSYRLPGTLSQWRVGGALRAQNEIYKTNNPIRQGGYTVVDVSAGWQATKSLDLRLNVYNLFDKTYYQAISTVASGNAFGAPRSFLVTAKYQF